MNCRVWYMSGRYGAAVRIGPRSTRLKTESRKRNEEDYHHHHSSYRPAGGARIIMGNSLQLGDRGGRIRFPYDKGGKSPSLGKYYYAFDVGPLGDVPKGSGVPGND